MRYLLLLSLCIGCSWGLGESRGYLAKRTEVAMAEIAQNANALRPVFERLENMEIREEAVEVVRRIECRAYDVAETARISQADHGYPPKEDIVLDSDEDQRQVNVASGLSNKKETRRRKLHGIIPGIFRFIVAAGAAVIPESVRKLIYWGVVVIILGAIVFALTWLRGRFYKKALVEYNDAVETLSPEQREELGRSRKLMTQAHKRLK